MDIMQSLSTLYEEFFGYRPKSVSPLGQAGSDRRYFRLSGTGRSVVGTYGADTYENRCFVSLANAFRHAGVNVPEVYAHSEDFRFYLQEDLGDVSLFSCLSSSETEGIVMKTLASLVKMQKVNPTEWESLCMARPFSSRQVMWDLNYFKYEYLKPSGLVFDEDSLEDDFEKFADSLLSVPREFTGFMMRDCQSRNVMIHDGCPYFIDFQGGRMGPVIYDAVSFLWQARAAFSPGFRERMLTFYADEFCGGEVSKIECFLSFAPAFVLFRTLQVLGAYGFRGLVQHKAHFILSIPAALGNLKEILQKGSLDDYPELRRICSVLVNDSRFVRRACEATDEVRPALTVEVFSFSYKKGYPEDFSGNGGGFMFDCRAMHNPGRYPEYRQLTGRDFPVVDFLERRGEVSHFLAGAWSLVDPAVERYISRGFTGLQIGFGCTGGQHRSVYCAEKTAAHLRILFPEINIILTHREHP